MDILIGMLTLAAFAGFCWGFVKLFKKGQRKRGLLYFCGAFGLLMASGFFVGVQKNQEAIAAGYASHEDQAKTQALQAQADRVARIQAKQDRLDALAREQGYADHAAQQHALTVARSAAEKVERDRLTVEQAQRTAAQLASQEAAEAAERAHEEARKARLAAKTVGMTEQIASLVRSYYGVEAVPLIPNRPMCREDGYCDFNVGAFRIQVYGAGLAVVEPTNQASLTDYVEMCAVAFAAISGSEMSYAVEAVGLIYGAALASGSAERDFNGVEVKFSPALGGAMGCRLFKY